MQRDLSTNLVLTGPTSFSLPSAPPTTYDVICFLGGTMIATPTGEVSIEDLKSGDLVRLADGGSAEVTWLGRQTVSTLLADPLHVQPIRIRENALADGVPSRDLLISPDHALLDDGILVAAQALVNDVSILSETISEEKLVYYHAEVSEHALILAENTPAETFVDNVTGINFDNWSEHPSAVTLIEMNLPHAKYARYLPYNAHNRLFARSDQFVDPKSQAA